jgi:phosphatidylglycerol---prolipoprotein diacylglyceryl transferase
MLSEENGRLIRTILTALAVGCVAFFAVTAILQPFFSGRIALPQNLHIGSFRIQYYGIILGLASLAGYWLAIKRSNKLNITRDRIDTIALILIFSGFVGARVYHVLSELPFYLDHPLLSFEVWNGGLSIFGAALGGLLGLLIYNRYVTKTPLPFLELLDWLTPSLVLGQIIGRFGNFLNYELYGTPTRLAWKMFVPIQHRLSPFELNPFFHPLFLYEATGSIIILFLLLKLKLKTGQLFLLWLFLYNVLRFFLEHLRVESVIYSGIRINAIVALIIVGLAVYFWYRLFYIKNAV